MKYICLSFDDARSNTFEYAFPILQENGLTATVNVITDYVNNPQNYSFPSAPKSMSCKQIVEWQSFGYEVACHGATHKNTANDIKKNIEDLLKIGVNTRNIGFASPESWLTKENIKDTGIDKLKKEGVISYIRTGIQIRREGIIYILLSIIEQITHSKWLYYKLNKKNIINRSKIPEIIPSAAIKDFTRVNQIKYFIDKVKDEEAIILMFHSIIPSDDTNYGTEHYCWSTQNFIELCKWLSCVDGVRVITTKQLINEDE